MGLFTTTSPKATARATETLRHEHEAILRMLDVLDEGAFRLDQGKPMRPEAVEGLVEFFTLFADRCHHGKEEEILFPTLEAKGLPRLGGPVGVMLQEHEAGRTLLAAMQESARQYRENGPEAGRRLARAAHEYDALLRDHIFKENSVLFTMAEGLLSEAEQEALAKRFERMEEEKMGAGTHERLHALMSRLEVEILG
jgi:hemerythrin-like domain-containing protein